MNRLTPREKARARLHAAGLSAEEVADLIDRATALVSGLEELATLDSDLPEPALSFTPIEEAP